MRQTILYALVLLSGCGGNASHVSSKPRFLSIGTAPPGGAFFVVGGALAEVLNDAGSGEWRVTAEATKGSLESIRRLDNGELELALANASITYFAVRGEQGWERPHRVRSLMTLAHNVMGFITPRGSGIESIRDLRGRRVVVGVAGAGWEYFIRPFLRAHGLEYDDFTPLHNTQAGAVDMLADGSADAAFLGGAIPTASLVRATSADDILFIPFESEARNELLASYPFYFAVDIPQGTYRGQDEVFEGLSFGSMHVIVREDMDEALAHEITRAIYENRARIVEVHPAGESITPDNVVRDTGTPFHPGAIRFYREIGIWPSE